MTTDTIQALESININPDVVLTGITFQQSGKHYQGAQYLRTVKGHLLFRTYCDGKLKMLSGELMTRIFSN